MREKDSSLPFRSIASVSEDKKTISLIEYLGIEFDEASKQKEFEEYPNHFLPHPYTFDYIFDMDSTQEDVYQISAVPAVESLEDGYNSTIFAYGQTGTGKTYTMEGFIYDYLSPSKGLIPRAIEDIFKYIENNSNSDTTFIIRVTYLQIYNESIDDLLKPEKKHLSIREGQKKGLYVEGLSEWAVRSPNDIYALLERGAQCRTKAYTNMNDVSSRSHAVFTIILEQMKISNGRKRFKAGKLNMVDLAGSERVKISGATGKQLDESRRINKSLSALGNVINALTDQKTKHIPYRDSKLTRLLQNSLGGNCKTSMIAMISPYDGSYNESTSTLNFAKRAKGIRIKAKINEEVNQNALISQYEKELSKLRQELSEKNEIINSNAFIKKIEMERIQAEKDKNEALQALEKASISFLQEREEKRKLEKKIEIMSFQMIPGGQKIKIEDTPEFKTLLQKHQILLQKDFNEKLSDLEKEKELMQISKEQVDSYNVLLHKQREAMDNLTINLKEKEDNISHLNEMIDSYEKIINEQDNIIEMKNQRIKLLENILIKNKVEFPKDSLTTNNSPIYISMTSKKYNSKKLNEKTSTNTKAKDNDEEKDNIINKIFNNEEKIVIKFSDNNINKDKEKISINKDNEICNENNEDKKIKYISNLNSLTSEDIKNNKESDIVKNSVKRKNNISEISFEKSDFNDIEDEENFNVILSKNSFNGKKKKVNDKKDKKLNLINISTQKKQEKDPKFINLSKYPVSSNLSKEKDKLNQLKKNNILIQKNEDESNFKSSKQLYFQNHTYTIESKDQMSFLVKNTAQKEKINRTVKTPDHLVKNRNRVKTHNKVNRHNMFLKKK
jgi:kinesin family protein 3/17